MRDDDELPWLPAPEEDAAAREFEKLRAEVTVLRRAIERVAVVLGQIPKADYSETLGEIAREQETIADRIDDIAKHTGANLPEGFFRAEIARAADNGLASARGSLDGAKRALADAIGALHRERERIVDAQARRRIRYLAGGFGAGLIVAALAVLVVLPALSDRWAEGIAATAIGGDRWNAGEQMMMHAKPDVWQGVYEATRMRDAGGKPLGDCYARAERAHKPVLCKVTLSPKAQ